MVSRFGFVIVEFGLHSISGMSRIRPSTLPCGQGAGDFPEGLRRLVKGAEEGAAHPLTIAKTCFLGDDFHGQSALLQEEFCFFQAELLDHLGGGVPRLGTKHAGKLPWTEAGDLG